MLNIVLFCYTELSVTLIAEKMQKNALERGIPVNIEVHLISSAAEVLKNPVDVILITPNAGYALEKIKKIASSKQTHTILINSTDYSMMQSNKILDQVLESVYISA